MTSNSNNRSRGIGSALDWDANGANPEYKTPAERKLHEDATIGATVGLTPPSARKSIDTTVAADSNERSLSEADYSETRKTATWIAANSGMYEVNTDNGLEAYVIGVNRNMEKARGKLKLEVEDKGLQVYGNHMIYEKWHDLFTHRMRPYLEAKLSSLGPESEKEEVDAFRTELISSSKFTPPPYDAVLLKYAEVLDQKVLPVTEGVPVTQVEDYTLLSYRSALKDLSIRAANGASHQDLGILLLHAEAALAQLPEIRTTLPKREEVQLEYGRIVAEYRTAQTFIQDKLEGKEVDSSVLGLSESDQPDHSLDDTGDMGGDPDVVEGNFSSLAHVGSANDDDPEEQIELEEYGEGKPPNFLF
ncbi:hypothetical protein ACFLZX_03240 [Nanoarchaeota archaeon]